MAEKGQELAKVGTVGSGSPGHKMDCNSGRVSIGIPVQASKVLRGCNTGVRVVMPSACVQCANFVLIERVAVAQVEANFSDAETSLQLAQAVVPLCSRLILDLTYSNGWMLMVLQHAALCESFPHGNPVISVRLCFQQVSDFIETLLQSARTSRLSFFSIVQVQQISPPNICIFTRCSATIFLDRLTVSE